MNNWKYILTHQRWWWYMIILLMVADVVYQFMRGFWHGVLLIGLGVVGIGLGMILRRIR